MNKTLASLLATSLLISLNSYADSLTEEIGDYSISHDTITSSAAVASGAISGPGLGQYISSSSLAPASRTLSGNYAGAYLEFDVASSPSRPVAPRVVYTDNGPGVLGNSGRTLTMGVQDMGFGLTLQRKVFIPADNSFVRWLNVITNTNETGEPIEAIFGIEGNMNHDAIVVTTSDADTDIETTDIWVITEPGPIMSPETRLPFRLGVPLAHVMNGSGDSAELAYIDIGDGSYASWEYPVEIAAGQTIIFMTFVANLDGFDENASVLQAQLLAEGLANSSLNLMSNQEFSQLASEYPGTLVLSGAGGGGGGCFIATAAYGTPMAQEINTLREVRDTYMLNNVLGTAFVDTYYRMSPPVADIVAAHPALASVVRMVLTPIVLLGNLILGAPMVLASGLIAGAGLLLARRHTKNQIS